MSPIASFRVGQQRAARVASVLPRFAWRACLVAVVLSAGCTHEIDAPAARPLYDPIPADKGLPPFLTGTVMHRTLLRQDTGYPVSAYALIGQLRGTGDAQNVPTSVREYMRKEAKRRGFGDNHVPGFGKMYADTVLRDPNYAIVVAEAEIPPGARRGDFVDVRIRCLEQNDTSALTHGKLYETDLKPFGTDPYNVGPTITSFVRAKGPILVNPAYALAGGLPSGEARISLRSGTVLGNGKVMQDRPLMLQLRQPSLQTSRAIENRIWERFTADTEVAKAQDQGIVEIYVPRQYRGDWEHFAGVVQHLWLENSPEFNVAKAKMLVAEAQKPETNFKLLEDISYAWEGIGHPAMPFIQPLLMHPRADVAFAAARAAAFIGDPTGVAEDVLVRMANTSGHAFQISAIRTLGELPTSSSLNHKLRDLLNSPQVVVRVEAYKVLARNKDSSIFTTVVGPAENPNDERFVLDIVESDAPPIIYASRQGMPRIAVIGKRSEVLRPITFTAMNNRLTITADTAQSILTLYFRESSDAAKHGGEASSPSAFDRVNTAMDQTDRTPVSLQPPVKVLSHPTLTEFIGRLGGLGPRGDPYFDLTYAEVLAVVQNLADQGQIISEEFGKLQMASFMMQDPPRLEKVMRNAPVITDASTGVGPRFDEPRTFDNSARPPAPAVASTPASASPRFDRAPADSGVAPAPAAPPAPATPAGPAMAPSGPVKKGPQFSVQ